MPLERTRRHHRGQIVIPSLVMILVTVSLFLGFMNWARRSLWQMRMDLAADATALSAARSQAEMLNYLSSMNVSVNLFIKKAQIPLIHQPVGGMPMEMLPAYTTWNRFLQTTALGFKTAPSGVGETVARLNGAQGYSPYFPFPMAPLLVPISMLVAVISKSPPAMVVRHYDPVYFARGWSPGYAKAQPPHKTTWLVSRHGIRSLATARLWLDITPGALLNNGGFPRVSETWWRGLLIQGFYPQFNARLLAKPVTSMENFLAALKRSRRTT